MRYDKICLMLPTYKRSGTLLPVFIESAEKTAERPSDLSISLCVNANDLDTMRYLEGRQWVAQHEIIIEDLPSPHLAKYFNMLYDNTRFNNPGTVVSMIGDDFEFKTSCWDTQLLNLINAYDGVGVFWCNDDYIARERMPANLFVTRKMVEATEEPFMCEKYPADMIDWIWGKVGKYTKSQHYLPGVIIKHNHNTSRPKEEWDSTFNRLRPMQAVAHREYGKPYARELARKIADRLIAKGMTGDNA